MSQELHEWVAVSGLYKEWFLDYASYVILERAVPNLEDGLKPVQRRIMHAMNEMEDGRYNKVANIIGQTMQYHPHGDASITEAMVNMGQKDLLIDTQGNWGDVRTGDGAAAARYIEARLSKFALEVVFSPKVTNWQLSYDGRKREPITLPVKFPLLLEQGVEGIAVGLATKILPHNFIELMDASIDILKGKKTAIFPDFPSGGFVDVANYNDGLKGGKVRVRAKIEELDNKTLIIKEIPFGTTTGSLIESIVKANDSGKIKIKKVIDNTAKEVEVMVLLAPNTSPDITIAALYAFTDCEVSISPNACIILNEKPQFLGVNRILELNTQHTLMLLEKELQIQKADLLEKLLFASLEKIFVENKIYNHIEEAKTWEEVLSRIDKGLEPFKKDFYRAINQDDLTALTEIKIKRISKFDSQKADEIRIKLEEELQGVEHNLANLVDFAVNYFRSLIKKYGKDRHRKTEIRSFDTIVASKVAANNQKLYINREEGFIGFGLKKDEFVADCSDIDDVIVFLKNGIFKVVKIAEKVFVGKDILHVEIFNKDDSRKVYNLAYLDGKTGMSFVKRFQIGGITRDREYDLTTGEKGSKVLYFSSNPNGEAETVTVFLTAGSTARIKNFDYNFAELIIKGRGVKGNLLSKYAIRKVQFKSKGASTLGGLKIWFDANLGTLNQDERGDYVGNFQGEDKILVLFKDGTYEVSDFALTNRYDPKDVLIIRKMDENVLISAIYQDGETGFYHAKQFGVETTTFNKKFSYIAEHPKSNLVFVSLDNELQIEIGYQEGGKMFKKFVDFAEIAERKGWKAKGNRLPFLKIKTVQIASSPSLI